MGDNHAVIEELVVTASCRRQGIGKRLILEAEKRICADGVRHIQLNVFSFNSGAQTLYESLGYNPLYLRLGKTSQ